MDQATGSDDDPPRRKRSSGDPAGRDDPATSRRRRRAELLAELAEARELRARVAPRRTRLERTRQALRHRLFRFDPPRRPQG